VLYGRILDDIGSNKYYGVVTAALSFKMQSKSWSQGWSFSHAQPPSASPSRANTRTLSSLHCALYHPSRFVLAAASANLEPTSSSYLTASNNIESYHPYCPRSTAAVGNRQVNSICPTLPLFTLIDGSSLRHQFRHIATTSTTHRS